MTTCIDAKVMLNKRAPTSNVYYVSTIQSNMISQPAQSTQTQVIQHHIPMKFLKSSTRLLSQFAKKKHNNLTSASSHRETADKAGNFLLSHPLSTNQAQPPKKPQRKNLPLNQTVGTAITSPHWLPCHWAHISIWHIGMEIGLETAKKLQMDLCRNVNFHPL